MGINSITFNKGQGGLGRPLDGTDYISGLLFYTSALPSGFTASDRIKIVYSVADAVALGITNTSLGETKSTATYLVTNKGAANDTHVLTCAIVGNAGLETVTLASYTQITADAASTTTAATRLAAEINLGTATHGFTASPSTATVTITAPTGQGVFLNSGTPYVSTVVGTLAGTLTQNVVTGVASEIDILYYHIEEFFRVQPKGKLYVGVYAVADVGTFASVTLMQNFATGEIKQLGIYDKSTAFATTNVTALQAVYNTLSAAYKPLHIVFNAEIQGTASVATLTDLRLLNAPNVSVTIGQDGKAKGFKLWKATAKSIGCVGTTLGAIALGKVSDSIAWVGKFNMSNVEFDVLNMSNGEVLTSLSDGSINNTDNFGYIFLKKHVGYTGSYFDRSHTCVPYTSDYAYIENARTIDKAIRSLRTLLLPQLASPLLVNSDGTLRTDVVSYYETLCARALDQMQRDEEISAYSAVINPSQNVVSTGTLVIAVAIVPVGVARQIVVNIGFTVQI
jgi:hypothetical protein